MSEPRTAQREERRRLWGVGLILLAAVMWSFNGPLIKLLAQTGADAWFIAFYRSLIAGVVLTPLALRRAGACRSQPRLGVSALVFTAMTASFILATTLTQAANAIALQYSAPVWVFLLSPWLLGERARREDRFVLVVALLGVIVIFVGQGATPDLAGLLVGLVAGLFYGLLLITLRWVRDVPPIVVTWVNSLGSALILVPVTGLLSTFVMSERQFGYLLLLGAVQFAIPYVLFSAGLQYVPAHRAALLTLIEPVLNPVWTFLAVGEVPFVTTVIGGGFILTAVAVQVVLNARRKD